MNMYKHVIRTTISSAAITWVMWQQYCKNRYRMTDAGTGRDSSSLSCSLTSQRCKKSCLCKYPSFEATANSSSMPSFSLKLSQSYADLATVETVCGPFKSSRIYVMHKQNIASAESFNGNYALDQNLPYLNW